MNKLLQLAQTKVGCGYVWGSQGEMLTPEKLEWFKNTFGASHYDFSGVSASKWLGKQCFDCSGLVLWCLQQLGFIGGNQDYNAEMFYRQLCLPTTKDKLVPGDLVFVKSSSGITHIGIYNGENETVEAMGTQYGVVYGTLHSGYNLFGKLKFSIGDVEEVLETPIGTGTVQVSEYLNVRSGPGATYEDIGDLFNGNLVPVYEEENGWYRIGLRKWVCGNYVTYVPTPKDALTELVEEMMKDGMVTDKQYWMDVLSGKIAPNPEYLKIAFKRGTDKIR